jgi:hypothetical protein
MPEGEATAGSGGATTGAAAATSSAPAGAGAGATPSPASAFDWKTSGLDETGLALVAERGWKAPGDVLQSYRNLETAVGVPPERLIKLPAPRDAGDPKVWNEIFTKMGKPVSADKYTIPVPEGDKGEFAKVAKDWFHGANLTQNQATTLATKWNEYTAAQTQAAKAAQDAKNSESVTELKRVWGSEYEANSALADKAAEKFGMTQQHFDALKEKMGPKDAMQWLFNIGKAMGVEEANPKGFENNNGAGASTHKLTPDQAMAKIQALKKDPTFAKMFTSEDPAQRMQARNEIDRLNKLAAPGVSPV